MVRGKLGLRVHIGVERSVIHVAWCHSGASFHGVVAGSSPAPSTVCRRGYQLSPVSLPFFLAGFPLVPVTDRLVPLSGMSVVAVML